MSRTLPWVGEYILSAVDAAVKHFTRLINCEKQFLSLAQKHKNDDELIKILQSDGMDYSQWKPWQDAVARMIKKNAKFSKDVIQCKDIHFVGVPSRTLSPFNQRVAENLSEQVLNEVFSAFCTFGLDPTFDYPDFYVDNAFNNMSPNDDGEKIVNDLVRCICT